ncbi:MAG: HypC/HybG/HupF family hydrogenase formation chaperone [Candidatus Binataceae bacterium]
MKQRPVMSIAKCHEDVCITCADQALEARVIELLPENLARVSVGGEIEVVSVALIDAGPGDRLLLHAGEAISKLDQ